MCSARLAGATTMVVGVDYTTNDVILGDQTGFNNTTANVTGLTFNATQPLASGQTIGNSSTTSDATLLISASSSFAGNIVDAVQADPAVAASLGTKKTNIAFTVPNRHVDAQRGQYLYRNHVTADCQFHAEFGLCHGAVIQRRITGLGAVMKSSAGYYTNGRNTYSGATPP